MAPGNDPEFEEFPGLEQALDQLRKIAAEGPEALYSRAPVGGTLLRAQAVVILERIAWLESQLDR